MKIKIMTFASVKEICGFSEKDIEISNGLCVADVVQDLIRDYKDFNRVKDRLLYAVNDVYCDEERILSDGDSLAVFPPVSGG